ncbi:hypothetical protein ACP70R_009301 [Stipagrostis hirtigluma subsp. patula]
MAPMRDPPAVPPALRNKRPPPPPAASDDEVEVVRPPAPKAPPPQKGQKSETDGEQDPPAVPPALRNKRPPPPPAASDDEEEVVHLPAVRPPAASTPAVRKHPPPPNREDEEDEAPKPAPTQKGEGKVAKPSSGEDKKPAAPFQRTWSTEDEIRILEALAAHRREHGVVASPDALIAALAGSLDLSKEVWGAANGSTRREYGEMCELFPYLAEEVKALEAKHPGLFKGKFSMITDDKARALDEKIKKQRMMLVELELHSYHLTEEVTKTLMELDD